ncbi:helix-turn-helix domain-containing protein [Lentisphaera profundi]|uniref:Helix-turn-helix domain-containing protein n=1 Tax=Lentisphaera profundi TaxID=1658616 RepID=A0ABY7VZJ4_9BACT|nr:helix-turn-helix domain-containing protein [Lentisphaera profundi]WDE99361.1 helix-turn-helix domain-containing protein [Lentisphaera profundi]
MDSNTQVNTKKILLALDWYDNRVHQGVAKVAQKYGWDLFCLHKTQNQQGIPTCWRGDGAITMIGHKETSDFFKEHKIPVIDLGLEKHGLQVPRVVTNNEMIGKMAANHFLERGFTNFYVPFECGLPMFEERSKSFKNTLKKAGYECQVLNSPNIYDEHLFNHSSDWWKKKLPQLQFPAALFAFEDSWAAQWLALLESMAYKIPSEVAILGADNDPLISTASHISLSSIDTDQHGLGVRAAEALEVLINQPQSASPLLIQHEPLNTITRASTDIIASSNPVVNRALAIIYDDVTINASSLAQKMDMSVQGLQRSFRAHFHMSPGQIIRQLRLRRVKHLLIHSKMSSEEISRQTGFYSIQALHLFFKRETGITPGTYKRLKIPKI